MLQNFGDNFVKS